MSREGLLSGRSAAPEHGAPVSLCECNVCNDGMVLECGYCHDCLEREIEGLRDALRRIATYPDTWQAQIANEALEDEA